MSAPVIMVCSTCGSEQVSTSATVRWDVLRQDWEVSDVHLGSDNYCDACQEEEIGIIGKSVEE